MKGTLLSGLLLAGIVLAPASASAEDAAADGVRLRNGGFYRGRVTEVVPGDHVTVAVEGGETKHIPWSEVEQLILPPGSRSDGSAAPAPTTQPPVGPLVRVHITSKTDVNLLRRPVGGVEWVEACVSPCDQELPAGDTYRITGNGIAAREVLLHADGARRVDIRVDPPSTFGMVGGGLAAGIGASAAFVGWVMLPSTCLGESSACGVHSDADERRGTVGGIVLVTGAVMALVGTLILVRSTKTDIELSHDGKHQDVPAQNHVREPAWRDVSKIEAPPMQLPISFTRVF